MDKIWILEYIKVLGGYTFLMFIWPAVVFGNYLRKKTKIFYFSFCVTVQPVIISFTVLGLGLFNILNRVLIVSLFYGVFLYAVFRECKHFLYHARLENKETGMKIGQYLKISVSKRAYDLWNDIRPQIMEYILLTIVIVYGMVYFSYGLFQIYSYGQYDMQIHHTWVNELMKGKIFPNGIYPEAMHCFIYSLSVLFGIDIYSVMLFLQCIHVTVFLLSGYSLLREIFKWRYIPIFTLCLYLTMDHDIGWSMSRLQCALPMEFGLHTQFLCALYLIRYLNRSGHIFIKGKMSKCCWDQNLFLFVMALAASLMTHYHTTIMAFILCGSLAVFSIKKIIRPEKMIPLIVSVLCCCIIVAIPVAGALVSGIPFEGSINWGLKEINSNRGEKNDNNEKMQEEPGSLSEDLKGPFDPTDEEMEIVGKLPGLCQRPAELLIKGEYFLNQVFDKGYQRLYWDERAGRIYRMTAGILVLCLLGKGFGNKDMKETINGYFSLILISFFAAMIFAAYSAPELGLVVLIPNQRFGSTGHLITLAVMMIPVDIIFSKLGSFLKDSILQIGSVIFTIGIYVFVNVLGIYHEYLYCVLARYNSEVNVTNSIIKEFPRDAYTVIAPFEAQCQIELYGRYEDITDFVENLEEKEYSFSTEYVFIYVEKRPIGYRQVYYYNGPAWLGVSQNSEIKAAEISHEAALADWRNEESEWQRRIIMESRIYEWCQDFEQSYPSKLRVYYEDEDFICYYFEQDKDMPYNLVIE